MPTKRILFPILNWGLGHATRSLFVIKVLLARGHKVTIASDGIALELLRKELPHSTFHRLPSYDITYHRGFGAMQKLGMATKIARAVKQEHRVVTKLVANKAYDLIISDNRYGAYHSSVTSILISHQLNLPLSGIFKWIGNWQVKKYVLPFNQCWIPDDPRINLSGSLSDGSHLKTPCQFIGILSRFRTLSVPHRYDLAVILSGPESQRAQLQRELIPKIAALRRSAIIVLGTSEQDLEVPRLESHMECRKLMGSAELNHTLCAARVVVCRSGYSSLMDLSVLGKPAILIPTSNQPEQEYLADHLNHLPQFVIQKQGHIDLSAGLRDLDYSKSWTVNLGGDLLAKALDSIGV